MNFDGALYASVHNFPAIGASVIVARGISETEHNMARFPERMYTVSRYTDTGYAVITDSFGSWHVHPEALDISEGGR